jgi:hypothetical protein
VDIVEAKPLPEPVNILCSQVAVEADFTHYHNHPPLISVGIRPLIPVPEAVIVVPVQVSDYISH